MKRTMALVLALTVAAGGFASGASAEETSKVTHYVALGDSLTVGYEPDVFPGIDPMDMNYYGFADRVYEQSLYHGRTEYVNYGLAGMTSTGLMRFLQAVTENRMTSVDEVQPNLADPRGNLFGAMTSQVKEKLEQADLVTITIGGNDFGNFQELIKGKSQDEITAMMEARLRAYQENASAILKMIYALNPKVKVAIADQYNPVPPADPVQYAQLQIVMSSFTREVDSLVKQFAGQGFSIVEAKVSQPFVGHELDWTHIKGADIHPNQAGYDVMAKVFSTALWGSYQQPKGNGGMRIIVDGSELETPYAPQVEQGTTYVPLREYAEKLGVVVSWNDATKTATITENGRSVSYAIGAGAQLRYGGTKTYVPLRSLGEGLGLAVQYVRKSNLVFVNR
ncbi:MAG: GDSL-type esterase/lipase family protein [Tumebacillaceae bacterium]